MLQKRQLHQDGGSTRSAVVHTVKNQKKTLEIVFISNCMAVWQVVQTIAG